MNFEIKEYGSYQGQSYDEICIYHEDVVIGFSNLGARITRWETQNKGNLILSFDSADQCFAHRGYYYGATVGRVAGRIKRGQFEWQGKAYQLDQNENGNHLHGGTQGFDIQSWDYEIFQTEDAIEIHFTYVDPDGLNGYPGQLQVKVIHRYQSNHCWTVKYQAESTKDTLFNPTNHVYFNLNGNLSRDIQNHTLKANVSHYAPVEADGIPLGSLISVENTSFDIRQATLVRDILNSQDRQIQLKQGFDHGFLFDKSSVHQLIIGNRDSNLQIKIETAQPAVVIYLHNFADESVTVHGNPLMPYAGIAIETQVLPDAIHCPQFGNIVLKRGQTYESSTTYQLIQE